MSKKVALQSYQINFIFFVASLTLHIENLTDFDTNKSIYFIE